MAKKKKIVKATYVIFVYEDDVAEVMLPNGQIATAIDDQECEISTADVDDAVFRITRGKKIFIHSGSDIEYAREYGGDDDATEAQRKRWKLEVHPTISFW